MVTVRRREKPKPVKFLGLKAYISEHDFSLRSWLILGFWVLVAAFAVTIGLIRLFADSAYGPMQGIESF